MAFSANNETHLLGLHYVATNVAAAITVGTGV